MAACGGLTIGAQVTADTRGSFARERDGPAPETRAVFLSAMEPVSVGLRISPAANERS